MKAILSKNKKKISTYHDTSINLSPFYKQAEYEAAYLIWKSHKFLLLRNFMIASDKTHIKLI